MSDNDTDATDAPTRRDYLRYGAVLGGGLVAGCAGGDGSTPAEGTGDAATDTPTPTPEETSTPAETPTETAAGTPKATPADEWSVTLSPVGEVTFDSVPESVYTGLPNTVDMAVAAGKADAVNSVYFPEYHGTLLNHYYARLDGVSLAWEGLTDSWGLGKEGFYELDSDLHLTDPAYAGTLDALDESDVAEIGDNVAPWLGNYYSNTHAEPPGEWADGYEYYDLWEIFRRVARAFRAEETYEVLHDEYRNLVSTIEAERPPEGERPSVALTFPTEQGITVFHTNEPGFLAAHTRPLDAPDAFGDRQFEQFTQVDMEGLAEADPDVVLALFRLASSYSIADTRARFEEDPVGATVSAVENDRVYAQGVRYQGPVANLFQLEMTAKQVYPDRLGEWPGYDDGEDYPEIPEDERLFDRQRVADAITGER